MTTRRQERTKVFISYSRQDAEWLERLLVHLKPLERDTGLDVWSDTEIESGSLWREEIEKALNSAGVAVLLVSANFMASDFISQVELPELLKAAKDGGAVILPVIIGPSWFGKTPGLSQFQSVNPLSRPLNGLSVAEQDNVLVKVAEEVARATGGAGNGPAGPSADDAAAAPGALPSIPATDLIDREVEVPSLLDRLRSPEVSLLTLYGCVGVGKTELALHVANKMFREDKVKTYFVPLGSLRDHTLVPTAIAARIGFEGIKSQFMEEGLKNYLRDKQLRLLLDNFEYVVEAADFIAELLDSCPQLKIIVTSINLLSIKREHPFDVSPLVPPEPKDSLDKIRSNPGVTLFFKRLESLGGDTPPDDNSYYDAAEICRRLDGLPLAIEIAAARARYRPLSKLIKELGERGFLEWENKLRDSKEQHETMRKTLKWNYDLLKSPAHEMLFRQLAIFGGGFTPDAAEAVCSAFGKLRADFYDAVEPLRRCRLLERGRAPGGEERFVMRETIRSFGLDLLKEEGEAEEMRRRHADHFVSLAKRAEEEIKTPQAAGANQRDALASLEADHQNMRAVLACGREAAEFAETALRLAGALSQFWLIRGHLNEGRKWLESLLALGGKAAPLVRAKALFGAGDLAWGQDDHEAAAGFYRESKELFEQEGDARGVAWSNYGLGVVARDRSDYVTAKALLEGCREGFGELEEARGVAWSLHHLGTIARLLNDFETATSLHAKSFDLFNRQRDTWGVAWSRHELGNIAHARRLYDEAVTQYTEALALFQGLEDRRGIGWSYHYLGIVESVRCRYEAATSHYMESRDAFEKIDDRRGLAWTLHDVGGVARYRGDYKGAAAYYEKSLALFKMLKDTRGLAWTYLDLSTVTLNEGNPARAAELLLESLAQFRKANDGHGEAWATLNSGVVAQARRDHGAAKAYYDNSRGMFEVLKNVRGVAATLYASGTLAALQLDYGEADKLYLESLGLCWKVEDRRGMVKALNSLFNVAVAQNQLEQAARLYGAAEALGETPASSLPPSEAEAFGKGLRYLKAQMGEDLFSTRHEEGRSMPLERITGGPPGSAGAP